jgi:23S rRNA G2445 N2-methylase RlmL
MATQRDTATLREAVRSSAFTPATRDIDGLVALLADDDDEIARGAELAIVRAGTGTPAAVVARLVLRLEGAASESRAGVLKILGRLAPKDAATAHAVLARLSDKDPRVQKAAANALGRLQQSEARAEFAAALVKLWDDAPELPVARAVAEAMGKLGVAEASERLQSMHDGDAELSRIARNATTMLQRDTSRGEASEVDGDRAGDFDAELVMLCRAGLESIVLGEVLEKVPTARATRVGPQGSGQVMATWRGALRELFALRTILQFAFALPPEPVANDGDLEAACVRALSSDAARQIFETWTKGTLRYRLDWVGKGHRRGTTWSVVHALAERMPTWVNDPTSSTWQVSIRVSDGAVRVLLTPKKLTDPRFVYRLRDVPAASHPTLAAALVRMSGIRDDDVVWDPFVGSASELVERARAGAYKALIGSDLDAEALVAARANVEAAGLEAVTLEPGDATTHSPVGVTRIITNPPMGRRVARDGSLAELLDRFTDHAAKVLQPGGRLAWLSPLGGRTAARAEANRLRVTVRQSVDMGGFHAELQVWEKPA